MDRIGVSVVGAGRVGRDHLRAIEANPGFHLIGVMDTDPRQVADAQSTYGAMFGDTDLETALGRPGVQAVIIASPTHLHAPMAIAALKHGLHALVEKPLAVNLTEAASMVGAARAARLILMGAQVIRFMPMFQAARQFVAEGGLGRPIHFIERRLAHRTEVFPWWRELPYFLIGHWGSHSVDLLLWLLGEQVASAYCDGGSEMPGYSGIDDFTLHLRLTGGTRASFHQSFSSRIATHDLVLVGAEATLTFECYRTVRVNGNELLSLSEAEMLRLGFANQLAAFGAGIRGERPVEAEAVSLLPLMAALEAAVDSLKSGKVEVPRTCHDLG